MILRHASKRASGGPNTNLKLLLIICVSVMGTIILAVAVVTLRVLRRRRRFRKAFREACLRDPSLTWTEYERRGRLTRSRLLFEEEMQRADMIRKSQQSRTSDYQVVAAPPEDPRAALSRSSTWHGSGVSGGGRSAGQEAGEGMESMGATPADWAVAEASVERTWQLLHSRVSRSLRAGVPPRPGGDDNNNQDDDEAPQRPPSVRLKTPPLLAHPLFRDGHQTGRPRHMSLPTELTRAKTDPAGPINSARLRGESSGGREH